MVELANTTNGVKCSTKRGIIFQARAASPSTWEAFTLFLNDDAGGNKYPENGLVKPPRRDTRALSPAGMSGGKAPLRLAAQKSRLLAPSVSMGSAPAYFLCK
jgi:hypothetical protein